jgi:uncharacterized repeat protein (TIGR01451 family)
MALSATAVAAPPGTTIENRGYVQFTSGAGLTSIASNAVELIVEPSPSRAALTLQRADFERGTPSVAQPTHCLRGGAMTTLPPPMGSNGQSFTLGATLPLGAAATVHGGEAVFLEVTDLDRNLDSTASDSLELAVTADGGDRETVALTETAADSGVFSGYVQTSAATAQPGDCILQVQRNAALTAEYSDPLDATDSVSVAALVDPFGLVFDSLTGAPVDGARVRLVLAATGAPAAVFGDDGVSTYPAEIITGQAVTDASGGVYRFPPGVYRFPLVAAGDYRVVVEPPSGFSAPSGVPETRLQTLPGAPYELGPPSFGAPLPVAGQVATAVDIPIDPLANALFVDKRTALDTAAIGDFVPYSVTVRNAGDSVPFTDVVVTDSLPRGLRYQAGSARLDDTPVEPTVGADGLTLTFALAELVPRQSVTLRYVAVVAAGATGSALVNHATARAGNGAVANTATATVLLREELFTSAGLVLGRVYGGTCDSTVATGEGVAGVRIYLEDGRYALTDDEGKYHFEGLLPGSHVVQLDTITLPPEVEPLRCDARVRSAGGATSQFVDLRGGSLTTADFVLAKRAAASGFAHTTSATARVAPRALASARAASAATAMEADLDVANVAPTIALLQPSEGFVPPVPTLRVAVSHLPDQQVRLTVNGHPVSALNYDGAESDDAKTVALSRWRGVDLNEGDNRLVATVVNAAGDELATLERVVRYGAGGVRAELVPEKSQLIADGRTQPMIALRVFDASGAPARTGTLGAYRVDAPYRTWWEIETLRDNSLLGDGRREPTFAVEADGLVRILLEPTAQTGTVTVRLRFNERQEQKIRAWLEPEQRDWILVGLGEGTAAHRTLTAAIEPPDVEDGYATDGRLAFFAKGRVKGSTLLTIAFDSERDRPLVEDRLFGTIEPDRYYTLYGDAVEQRFEAPTTRKLYLKVERRQFSALFGDFDTGLAITELGRYSRTLTGFKADFGGERASVNAFAAENRETYGRDELRGDGTSGPFRLARGAIVANSDRLRIEVRDRVRSEVVLESRPLTRFIDYSLDYFTGTVFFKQPIASRDQNFNPTYVIAEYETLDTAATGTTAGARAAARLAGDKLELGATLIGEGSTLGDRTLAGTDLRYRPTGALEVRAELAQTHSDQALRPASASAYLAELAHVTERLDLQAYVREQEAGFGVGQQQSSEAGTRKIGVDARTELTERWSARGEAFHQNNLQTGADRELISAEARRETADATASIGLRSVIDDLPLTGRQSSELLSLGGSRDVARDRVTLRALTERSLADAAESLDFPERTTLGVDYHLSGTTTLFTEIEDAKGELIDARMTRAGVRSAPWSGSQLTSSVNREFGEYGPRVFATVGLTQSFKLGESWAMDVGVDQSDTLSDGITVERFNPSQPLVVGSLGGDFLATFVGAQYRANLWTITSRFERRDSTQADRRSFVGGFFREPLEGRALSVTTRWLDNDALLGAGRLVDARLSYAYRPSDSRFIVLQRLDLEQDERNDPLGRVETSRFVDNVNLHWQLGNRFELGTQLGARYARSTIDDTPYSGWSTLFGMDARRDLTAILDFGVHGTRLDSEAGGTTDRSLGIDLGINAARNMWVSVGYNFVGFRDDHFDASRYTADGPYVKFRFKADQDTFKDLDLSRLRPGGR